MKRLGWVLLAPAMLACAHAAQSVKAPTEAEPPPARSLEEALERLKAQTDKIFADHKAPNAALGVVLGGKLIWFRGFGERAPTGHSPIDENTAFRIGSITKTLTAVALLQLRDAGKLSLDDPLTRWIPEAVGVVNPGVTPIRLRNLVTHTSGLGREVMPHEGPTRAEVLAALKGLPLDFEPGTAESYSNYAMALAGVVVERSSGEPYRQYMQRHVFDALEMSSTAFDAEILPVGMVASGYERHGEGPYQPIAKQRQGGAMEPCGGLYSTIHDLANYAAFELGAWSNRPSPVLSVASRLESQTPTPLSLSAGGFVGVNWFIDQAGIGRVVWHTGAIRGYSASVSLFPNRDLAVLALTGSDEDNLMSQLQDSVVDALKSWAPARGAKLAPTVQTALSRLIELINDPSAEKLPSVFGKEFLALLHNANLESFVEKVHATAGKCPAVAVAVSGGNSNATVWLSCEKSRKRMDISTEMGTGLISGWLVTE